MALQVTTVMLGVEDIARSKKFYAEGMGCKLDQDYPHFVLLSLGEGSSSLALYQREAVDDVMGNAVAAGGSVVKAAAGTQWGYFGYFSDPDGYLWKVATDA